MAAMPAGVDDHDRSLRRRDPQDVELLWEQEVGETRQGPDLGQQRVPVSGQLDAN